MSYLYCLPDAAFLTIIRHLGNLQDIWNFEAADPLLEEKFARLLWKWSHALLIGTDGRYGVAPQPPPLLTTSFARQCSIDSAGGLKSCIRTPGDTTPRPKYRVRFELENAVWNYAAPRLHLVTKYNGDAEHVASSLQRWPLCTEHPSTSDAFNLFCGYVESVNTPATMRAISGRKLLWGVRGILKELHFGPIRERVAAKALQKFLASATFVELRLQRIVLTYDSPDFLSGAPRKDVVGAGERLRATTTNGSGFPSRNTHIKFIKLVQRNANTLNYLKLYVDEDYERWVSVSYAPDTIAPAAVASTAPATAGDVENALVPALNHVLTVEYNCESNNDYRQCLHSYLCPIAFENRPMPTRAAFKIWVDPTRLRITISYILSSGIPYKCRESVKQLSVDILMRDAADPDDDDDDFTRPEDKIKPETEEGQRHKILKHLREFFFATNEFMPNMLESLKTLEWRFPNLEFSSDEFHEVCAAVRPFRSALTTVQMGKHREIIGPAGVAEKKATKLTEIAN